MALPQAPDASSTGGSLAAVAGSDRYVFRFIGYEQSGFSGTLNSGTYGGQSGTIVVQDNLPGNQLGYAIIRYDETAIAARATDNFSESWTSAPSSSFQINIQYNNVEQSLPINPTIQEQSNASGGIASPNNIAVLDGGVGLMYAGNGNGNTFTWTNYTTVQNGPGGGYRIEIATQAFATAGSKAGEYDAGATNRSFLVGFGINEVGSVGVGISDVNSGNPVSPGDNNIVITGSKFEAVQGAGSVTISPTDNISDTNAVNITSVDSWSDTSIQLDIPPTISLLYGDIYFFVTNDSAESNATGFMTTLEPPAGRQFETLFVAPSDSSTSLVGGLTIESEADQVEWQTLSDNNGMVDVDINGEFTIRYQDGNYHDGSGNAATLSDSKQNWETNQWVGATLTNVTDGSTATVTANTSTTITGTLSGGTDNDWDLNDQYTVAHTIPDTDTIYVRLGDNSDQTWSSNDLEEVGINQAVGGEALGNSLNIKIGIGIY